MKKTLLSLLVVLSLCAPGMAQTKAKPTPPQVDDTGTTTTTLRFRSGGSTVWAITLPGTPISIDGETADCTTPHLIKALKIAAAMIADPNQSPCSECYSVTFLTNPLSSTISTNYPYRQKPADEKRAQAERLKAEAAKLEVESKQVQWVRAVMAGCER